MSSQSLEFFLTSYLCPSFLLVDLGLTSVLYLCGFAVKDEPIIFGRDGLTARSPADSWARPPLFEEGTSPETEDARLPLRGLNRSRLVEGAAAATGKDELLELLFTTLNTSVVLFCWCWWCETERERGGFAKDISTSSAVAVVGVTPLRPPPPW